MRPDSWWPGVARHDGIPATGVLDAVLSFLPLEKKDPQSCWRVIANGSPENDLPI
jgi:L-fucose mutarotase/ribose pyranase (RbsD/FucU family)